jgi:hypothetical protein
MTEAKSKRVASKFTAIRMERRLYSKARRQARARHQTFSEYVRQLIVSDVAEKTEFLVK